MILLFQEQEYPRMAVRTESTGTKPETRFLFS